MAPSVGRTARSTPVCHRYTRNDAVWTGVSMITSARYVEPRSPVPSDLDIAQEAPLEPILSVAERVGLTPDDLELFGTYKAKVHLDVRDKLAEQPLGKYIDVTAITPTPVSYTHLTLPTITSGCSSRWSADG